MFKTLRRLKIYNLRQEYLDGYSNFGFNNQDSYLSAIGHGNLEFREIHNKINPNDLNKDTAFNKTDKSDIVGFRFIKLNGKDIITILYLDLNDSKTLSEIEYDIYIEKI